MFNLASDQFFYLTVPALLDEGLDIGFYPGPVVFISDMSESLSNAFVAYYSGCMIIASRSLLMVVLIAFVQIVDFNSGIMENISY